MISLQLLAVRLFKAPAYEFGSCLHLSDLHVQQHRWIDARSLDWSPTKLSNHFTFSSPGSMALDLT